MRTGAGGPRLGGGQDCFRHGVAGALTVKGAQSARKIPAGEIGQDIPHAREPEVLAAPVSGLYPSGHMYRPVSGKKISDRFDRNVVMIATRAEGGGLYAALERDGTQRKASVNRFIIRRLYRNGDRRVGVDTVTCPTAHTVNHDRAALRRRRDHLPTRAHTERIHAALSRSVREGIPAAPRSGMSCHFSVEQPVDVLAPVLDTHAHRYGLGDDLGAACDQHPVGIARAVPRRQHHDPGRDIPARRVPSSSRPAGV